MSKYVKNLLSDDLKQRWQGVEHLLLVSLTGINANNNSALRKRLRDKNINMVMVKNSMSRDDTDRSFAKLQNNRQLALKYIANVTYGYISASFSGRMPCAEIADSIVQTGRETLEKVGRTIFTLTVGHRSHSF